MDSSPQSTVKSAYPFPQSQEYQTRFMKTPLQRHCAFFDRDCDGVISMSDTFKGLQALGYNLLFCLLGTAFIHLTMSYQTSPSWIPSLSMPIYLDRIERCRHGSSTKAYDFEGNVVTYPALQSLFARFDTQGRGGLNAAELAWMIWNLRDSYDLFGWMMSVVWWTALFLLAADKRGILSQEVMLSQYDGSIFYAIERQQQQQQQSKKEL